MFPVRMWALSNKNPPPGWTVANGQLEPDRTVSGYLARGCEVRGRCHLRDCRRTCHLDFARMVQLGQGKLSVRDLLPTFKCVRLGGCALDFHEEGGMEPTLGSLQHRGHAAIRFGCLGCRRAVVVRPAQVLAKLTATGAKDPYDTPLSKVGGYVTRPCPHCKGRRWNVDVLWHDPEGKAPVWRQDLDRR